MVVKIKGGFEIIWGPGIGSSFDWLGLLGLEKKEKDDDI